MVTGKLYKLANLDKNRRNKWLTSYGHGMEDGKGWLWTSNYPYTHISTFSDGDVFVCLGKKQIPIEDLSIHHNVTTWYEAVGPDGKIHKITPSMRTAYFRNT
jgi:hypothetical protein